MNKQFVLLSLLAVCLFSSCASRKNFVYLSDMQMGEKYPFDTKHEAVVHSDDRLGISVTCKNQELAIPFNIQGGNFRVDAGGNVKSSDISESREKGYRVDADGNIDFPILGKLYVEGMKVSQVKTLIENRIKEGNYIKDPLVSIEFLNFKYTVLGAVGRNGTFNVNGDRVTLLEAIANAGDLTAKARIDRVAVIRESGGERRCSCTTCGAQTSSNLPVLLAQNDIVYVEPKYRKKDSEDRGWQIGTTLLSVVTAICSIIWATK